MALRPLQRSRIILPAMTTKGRKMPDDPTEMSLHALTQEMRKREDSLEHLTAKAELLRRQMLAQLEANVAQKAAAEAQVEAARIGRVNAWLMFASVIVALTVAIASAFSAYFAYLAANQPHL